MQLEDIPGQREHFGGQCTGHGFGGYGFEAFDEGESSQFIGLIEVAEDILPDDESRDIEQAISECFLEACVLELEVVAFGGCPEDFVEAEIERLEDISQDGGIDHLSFSPDEFEDLARVRFESFRRMGHEPDADAQCGAVVEFFILPNEFDSFAPAVSQGFLFHEVALSWAWGLASGQGAQGIGVESNPLELKGEIPDGTDGVHHEVGTIIGIVEIKPDFHGIERWCD